MSNKSKDRKFYLFCIDSILNIKSNIIVTNLHRLQAYKIIQRRKIYLNIFLLYFKIRRKFQQN